MNAPGFSSFLRIGATRLSITVVATLASTLTVAPAALAASPNDGTSDGAHGPGGDHGKATNIAKDDTTSENSSGDDAAGDDTDVLAPTDDPAPANPGAPDDEADGGTEAPPETSEQPAPTRAAPEMKRS